MLKLELESIAICRPNCEGTTEKQKKKKHIFRRGIKCRREKDNTQQTVKNHSNYKYYTCFRESFVVNMTT